MLSNEKGEERLRRRRMWRKATDEKHKNITKCQLMSSLVLWMACSDVAASRKLHNARRGGAEIGRE